MCSEKDLIYFPDTLWITGRKKDKHSIKRIQAFAGAFNIALCNDPGCALVPEGNCLVRMLRWKCEVSYRATK